MSKESLYSTLWSASATKPYDEARESDVARRRFEPAVPAIEEALARVKQEGRKLRLLDFGCADGHTAEQILSPHADGIDYHGCDVYDLDATQKRMVAAGFSARVCGQGLSGIPPEWPTFDVVLALSCFQYISPVDHVFADLVARLAPDGVMVGYFYDAGPLRQRTDAYFREALSVPAGVDDEAQIERLAPLASLFASIRDAADGRTVDVREDVPELGLVAGEIPLQQLLIDHVLFAWAPPDASRMRIQWALAEMFLTGDQTYVSAEVVADLLAANSLETRGIVSGPSGHLAIAVKT